MVDSTEERSAKSASQAGCCASRSADGESSVNARPASIDACCGSDARTETTSETRPAETSTCCGAAETADTPQSSEASPSASRLALTIDEMCCPTEEGVLRKALADLPLRLIKDSDGIEGEK